MISVPTADGESQVVSFDLWLYFFWAVETGDWYYFPETGGNADTDLCALETATEYCEAFDEEPMDMMFSLNELSNLHHAFCDCHADAAGTVDDSLVLLCNTDCQTLLDRLDTSGDGQVDMPEFEVFLNAVATGDWTFLVYVPTIDEIIAQYDVEEVDG